MSCKPLYIQITSLSFPKLSTPCYSATIPGSYDQAEVDELMRESIKMSDFEHPNILTLIGVCVDGGPSPYIVTPFMHNGSLLLYLKNYQTELVFEDDANRADVCLSMWPNLYYALGQRKEVS